MAHAKKVKTPDTAVIITDPNILLGKPVVKGTRISVELILEKLGGGYSIEELLESYPSLTKEGIHAALIYAAKVLKTDIVEPLPNIKKV